MQSSICLGKRLLLITKEQWEARKGGAEEQMGFEDLEDTAVPEDIY